MILLVFQQISRLRYWLACATFIVGLSIYGRKLQMAISTKIDPSWIAAVVFILLIFILLTLYKRRDNHSISRGILILSFCLVMAGGAAVYFKYLLPIETLHFLVFFCYGWVSAAVFGPVYGTVAVLGLGIGDEILQYYLPSRVGDLHDVLINTLSGFSGFLLRTKW